MGFFETSANDAIIIDQAFLEIAEAAASQDKDEELLLINILFH